jgi:hypothetical protein
VFGIWCLENKIKTMNKKYTLYNLKEAKEQLDEILLELENNSE